MQHWTLFSRGDHIHRVDDVEAWPRFPSSLQKLVVFQREHISKKWPDLLLMLFSTLSTTAFLLFGVRLAGLKVWFEKKVFSPEAKTIQGQIFKVKRGHHPKPENGIQGMIESIIYHSPFN